MSDIGIRIDHQRAVLVSLGQNTSAIRPPDSAVEGHPRDAGGQEHDGEKRYEHRFGQQLDRDYDHVIGALGTPRSLLILGPGEATRELQARLARVPALAARQVAVEAADVLTELQIVAKVTAHFTAH